MKNNEFPSKNDEKALRYEQMYRDIMLNIEMDGENGTPFVCEVQVTLSGITILKKSPQALAFAGSRLLAYRSVRLS